MLKDKREVDGKTYFEVANVFIPPIVAGRLIALWEKEHGKEGSYDLTVSDNTLQLAISP